MARILRYASFKGIRFETLNHTDEFKRNVIRHPVALASEAFFEDNGIEDEGFKVEGLLCGPDASWSADLLRKKLKEDKTGRLIHPVLGLKMVLCRGFSIKESFANSGQINLTLDFIEIRDTKQDMLANIADSIDKGRAWIDQNIIGPFTEALEIARMPSYVLSSSVQILTDLNSFFRSENGLGIFGSELSEAGKALGSLEYEALRLLESPADLARSIVEGIRNFPRQESAFNLFFRLERPRADQAEGMAEHAEIKNKTTLSTLVGLASVLALSDAVLSDSSRKKALMICEKILEEPGDEKTFLAASELRNEIERRPRGKTVVISEPLPSLVLLYQLGLSPDQEESFCKRYEIRDPFRIKGCFYASTP